MVPAFTTAIIMITAVVIIVIISLIVVLFWQVDRCFRIVGTQR